MVEVTQADREARCQHGTRWPHQCDECDDDNLKPHNLIARIEELQGRINVLRSLADEPAMVERVARGMCVFNGDDPNSIYDDKPMWVWWFDEARAALRAIGGVE